MKKFVTLIYILLFVCTVNKCFAAPNIICSIKPVNSLVAAITEGVTTPELIIPGKVSPHNFQLKPSIIKKLNNAALIIWVGQDLESSLAKVITNHSNNTKVLTLSKIDKLVRHSIRGNGCHGHDHKHEHGHTHNHNHSHDDPHLWLSIDNMIVFVETLNETLINLDKENSETYKANTIRTVKKLEKLKLDISSKLKHSKKSFLVLHDSLQYFEKEFQLNGKGAIKYNPSLPSSAKSIIEISNRIKSENISCIYKEPQHSDKLINTVASTSKNIKLLKIDPLGAHLDDNQELYFKLINNIASKIQDCS